MVIIIKKGCLIFLILFWVMKCILIYNVLMNIYVFTYLLL